MFKAFNLYFLSISLLNEEEAFISHTLRCFSAYCYETPFSDTIKFDIYINNLGNSVKTYFCIYRIQTIMHLKCFVQLRICLIDVNTYTKYYKLKWTPARKKSNIIENVSLSYQLQKVIFRFNQYCPVYEFIYIMLALHSIIKLRSARIHETLLKMYFQQIPSI